MQNNEISQSLEERKSLKIKKLISLMAKNRCLYILIETEESNNSNCKIYKEEINNQLPIFFTSTNDDPNFLREGEIYKITNEKFLDSIINTEKYSQIILLDKGYLYEREKEKLSANCNVTVCTVVAMPRAALTPTLKKMLIRMLTPWVLNRYAVPVRKVSPENLDISFIKATSWTYLYLDSSKWRLQ